MIDINEKLVYVCNEYEEKLKTTLGNKEFYNFRDSVLHKVFGEKAPWITNNTWETMCCFILGLIKEE